MGFIHGLISLLLGICIGAECGNSKPMRKVVGGAPRVKLHQATVEGFFDLHNNTVFLGIPFAATTGGENRWRAPQDVPKARGNAVFNATQYGATCPQAISGTLYSQQDEDCLNLNVWAPAQGSKLPVFVYMYGGAMVTGSSSNPQFQGNNFARKDVIFVSFNTRESIFAYPNSAELGKTESQNFGILDVNKALEWVQKNIAAFGGDPHHIVFGGHSSGSVQVDHYLWNNPQTKLAGAVQMAANAKSGPAVAPVNQALDIVAAEVGCPASAQGGQLDCLRKVNVYDFQTEKFNATYNTWFTPVVDNITRFQDYEGRFAAGKYASHVPLLTGNSDGEGAIFSLVYGAINSNFSAWLDTFDADVAEIPKDLLLAAYNASDYATVSQMSGAQYGDARFFCPVDYLRDLRSTTQRTWTYRFFGNYSVGLPVPGPTHGTEIPFFLGGNECFDAIEGITEAEQDLADFQNDWFVSWIKNPQAGPGWECSTPKNGTFAKLGVPGNELAIELGATGDYNGRCQSVYNPYLPQYPVIQDVTGA